MLGIRNDIWSSNARMGELCGLLRMLIAHLMCDAPSIPESGSDTPIPTAEWLTDLAQIDAENL